MKLYIVFEEEDRMSLVREFFLIPLFILIFILILASSLISFSAIDKEKVKYRSQLLEELREAEAAFIRDKDDSNLRKNYAKLLFESGEFWKAREILRPLVKKLSKDIEVQNLEARLSYMMGDFESAEKRYKMLIKITNKNSKEYENALKGLALVYFQTHQYEKVKNLPDAENFKSFMELMRKFPEKPYHLEWENKEKTSILPFEIKGMLPTMKVIVNGKELEFILDTGGNLFYIDKTVAEECGLKKLVTHRAKYAYTGGEEVEEFLGVADSVKLGEVTLKNVPFSLAEWKSRGIQSDGVVTTQALKEFLSTIDYAHNRIILRERCKKGLKKFRESVVGKEIVEIPFVLDATHLMFARGCLNGRGGLTFLVDSGLASSMPFVATDGLIEDMGLELRQIEGTKYSWFKIGSLGLGELVLEKQTQGLAGVIIEENPYWRFGFIWDGLISHQFLKNFSSWTIDFDNMTYVFER